MVMLLVLVATASFFICMFAFVALVVADPGPGLFVLGTCATVVWLGIRLTDPGRDD